MRHRQTPFFVFPFLLGLCCWPACKSQSSRPDEGIIHLRVGASPVPHADILKQTVGLLRDHNIFLDVIVFTDYVQPNLRLADGDLDANYYQTQAYLDIFEAARHQNLVSMASVHMEPFGLYSKHLKSLGALPIGSKVAIPNEASNGYRALALLEKANIISLDPNKGRIAGVRDIQKNERRLKFVEVDAAMLPRVLDDVAIAGINTNFALSAGFLPRRDALAIEDKDAPYANILAVRAADQDKPVLKILVEALRSSAVREYVRAHYGESLEMR